MAAAFRSHTSTTYASRTNTTLTAPTGLANNDILFAAIFTGANTSAPSPTAPAGFTAVGTPTSVSDLGSFNGKLSLFWKRAASESGSYTFTHASASSQGLLLAISGCITSGSPVDVSSSNTGTNNTSTATGVTTTAANDLLLYIGHDWQGLGTLSPPTGMTERFDSLLYAADVIQASAGATGNKVQTTNNSNATEPWAAWLVALKEATASGISGTLNSTIDAVTQSATGKVIIQGQAAQTISAVTQAATGKVLVQGALAATIDPITQAATGQVVISGAMASTIAPVTLAASGGASITGTLAQTIDPVTQAASGKVLIQGSLAATIGNVAQAATGQVVIAGSLAATIAPVTQAASGGVVIKGSFGKTIDPVTLAATGLASLPAIGGTFGQAIEPVSLAAFATISQPVLPRLPDTGGSGNGSGRRRRRNINDDEDAFQELLAEWRARLQEPDPEPIVAPEADEEDFVPIDLVERVNALQAALDRTMAAYDAAVKRQAAARQQQMRQEALAVAEVLEEALRDYEAFLDDEDDIVALLTAA